MKWISVKDILPENDIMVLGYSENIGFSLCRTWIKRFERMWTVNGVYGGPKDIRKKRAPTHWMPLPEPPEEKNENT